MRSFPLITFGIIVLNGEPFVRYNLRALYPFAHQIIVVEGAVTAAAAIATPDGHSTDSTLETLHQFKVNEDPEDKVEIVTKVGFWSEKDEQSQAYAGRATGDYLWQVDIDEFYRPEDMTTVLNLLQADPALSAVFFKQISFWGGFDFVSDGWYLRQRQGQGPGIVARVFKWGPGYRYSNHRPVTVHDSSGRDLSRVKPLNGRDLGRQGIYMYHYSLVFPKQVIEKSLYYDTATWTRRARKSKQWAKEVYLELRRPYRVHNIYWYPSWLASFRGSHAPQIEMLRNDIQTGRIDVIMRPTNDIERLLNSHRYQLGRAALRLLDPIVRFLIILRRRLRSLPTRLPNVD